MTTKPFYNSTTQSPVNATDPYDVVKQPIRISNAETVAGPPGPQGAPGATGATGPQGTSGNITTSSGTVLTASYGFRPAWSLV